MNLKLFQVVFVVGALLTASFADVALAQRGRGGGRGGGQGGGGQSGSHERGDRGGGERGGSERGGGDRGGRSAFQGQRDDGMRGDSRRGGRDQGEARTSYYRDGRDFDRDGRSWSYDRDGRRDFDRNYNRQYSAFFGPRGPFYTDYLGRSNFNNYGKYGRGFGYCGYRGYGGYGLGYGGDGYGYGFLPFLGGLGLGYGLGNLGYDRYYGGYFPDSYVRTVPVYPEAPVPPQEPTNPPPSTGIDYVAIGEADFRAGRYQAAIGAFRHAIIDEPNNAGLMLLIAQSLFQIGQWTEAAGATELAMGALPEDKWGTVVQNYTQLYGNIEDYTKQLKTLEAAAKQKPDDPALRFLLGYHFGYLNFPQQAVRELAEAVRLEPRDPAARRLHDIFAAKTGAQPVGPVPESLATPEGAAKE